MELQSGPLNMNIRGNKKLFTLRGILNKTGKIRCDCDETGFLVSFILLGFLNYKGTTY